MLSAGPSKRVIAGTLLSSTYCIGVMLLGAIAMYTENFRYLLRALYVTVLLVLALIWWIPESVRWLIQMGRNEEAVKIIRNAAKTNKVKLTDGTEQELEKLKMRVVDKSDEKKKEKSDILSALRSKTILLRLLNCCYCFFVNDLVYFGLSVHSVTLGGNKYTNFILIGLSEIPAVLSSYILMDKLGRKWSIFVSMMLSGGACILTEILPDDATTWRLVLFILGKGGISVSITVLYVYCSELFPTNVRQTLLSVGCTFGRLGSMSAPQTPLLVKKHSFSKLSFNSVFESFVISFFIYFLGTHLASLTTVNIRRYIVNVGIFDPFSSGNFECQTSRHPRRC